MNDKKLDPKDVNVVIETHKVYCLGEFGAELATPYVESIEAGSQVTEQQIHQTVKEAIDDWYHRRQHEQETDQGGDAEGAQETEAEGGPGAADPPTPGDPGRGEAS